MKKEKKFILNIGLNDKDTKIQKISTIEAYKIVENTLLNKDIKGYTIYEGQGLYKHDNGEITRENTLIVELMFVEEEQVDKVLQTLKITLNQESILKQVQELFITFE
jgi:hypothetical protein